MATSDSIAASEDWRSVIGFESFYDVSSLGRVRSIAPGRTRRRRILKPLLNLGYELVDLRANGRRRMAKVHALVLDAFVGPRPVGMVINHIDFNRRNNHVTNLEYVSQRQNVLHSMNAGRLRPPTGDWRSHTPSAIAKRSGERNGNSKLTVDDVAKIRAMSGHALKAIAGIFGVSYRTVRDIRIGRTWMVKGDTA